VRAGKQRPQYFQFPKPGYDNDGFWNLNYVLEEGQSRSSGVVTGFRNEGSVNRKACSVTQAAR